MRARQNSLDEELYRVLPRVETAQGYNIGLFCMVFLQKRFGPETQPCFQVPKISQVLIAQAPYKHRALLQRALVSLSKRGPRQHSTIHHTDVATPQHIVLIYGVATISRLLKMIGLFCKRAL